MLKNNIQNGILEKKHITYKLCHKKITPNSNCKMGKLKLKIKYYKMIKKKYYINNYK
jgi:hypothetical protein